MNNSKNSEYISTFTCCVLTFKLHHRYRYFYCTYMQQGYRKMIQKVMHFYLHYNLIHRSIYEQKSKRNAKTKHCINIKFLVWHLTECSYCIDRFYIDCRENRLYAELEGKPTNLILYLFCWPSSSLLSSSSSSSSMSSLLSVVVIILIIYMGCLGLEPPSFMGLIIL